jgi:RNA polymerase sigma factor (sigma-70 family)
MLQESQAADDRDQGLQEAGAQPVQPSVPANGQACLDAWVEQWSPEVEKWVRHSSWTAFLAQRKLEPRDVAQETIRRVLRKPDYLAELMARQNPLPGLRRVAQNYLRDEWDRWSKQPHEELLTPEAVEGHSTDYLSQVIADEIIASLSPREQQIVRARLHGYSDTEIARMLQMSRTGVSRAWDRIRERIQRRRRLR